LCIKPNKLESKFNNIIISNNLPFEYVGDNGFAIVTDKRTCIPDFRHISKKQVIECNGDIFHDFVKDTEKVVEYRSKNWRVLNLTGSLIKSLNETELVKIVTDFESGIDREILESDYKEKRVYGT